jgi:hypothetical protein
MMYEEWETRGERQGMSVDELLEVIKDACKIYGSGRL